MKEKFVDIPTADGKMDSFVVHPEEGGPFPAVLVLMDIWGLREELYDIARRIAAVGYHCTLSNLWYRNGKVRYEPYRKADGNMPEFADLPKPVLDGLHGNMAQLTDAMAVRDIGAMLKFLDGEPVKKGPKGSIGYCLGGRLSLAAAAAYPDELRASASLHGTRMVSDKPDSVHKQIDRMRGEIYCGFAESDHLAPLETVAELGRLMEGRSNVKYRAIVHPGTVHGYSVPDRDVFKKASANRDWEHIFAMYRRQLVDGI